MMNPEADFKANMAHPSALVKPFDGEKIPLFHLIEGSAGVLTRSAAAMYLRLFKKVWIQGPRTPRTEAYMLRTPQGQGGRETP